MAVELKEHPGWRRVEVWAPGSAVKFKGGWKGVDREGGKVVLLKYGFVCRVFIDLEGAAYYDLSSDAAGQNMLGRRYAEDELDAFGSLHKRLFIFVEERQPPPPRVAARGDLPDRLST